MSALDLPCHSQKHLVNQRPHVPYRHTTDTHTHTHTHTHTIHAATMFWECDLSATLRSKTFPNGTNCQDKVDFFVTSRTLNLFQRRQTEQRSKDTEDAPEGEAARLAVAGVRPARLHEGVVARVAVVSLDVHVVFCSNEMKFSPDIETTETIVCNPQDDSVQGQQAPSPTHPNGNTVFRHLGHRPFVTLNHHTFTLSQTEAHSRGSPLIHADTLPFDHSQPRIPTKTSVFSTNPRPC